MKTKRLFLAIRKARKAFTKSIIDDVDDYRVFKKKAPYHSRSASVEMTEKDEHQLTPKEKIFALEQAIHKVRLCVMDNEGESRGRLTREQSYMLCVFKKEMDAIKSGEVY
jgi:hypothetical protein